MLIGINGASRMVLTSPLDDVVGYARQAEADGFASFWLNQQSGTDALTLLALVGAATDRIGLGTAVTPTWTRPPEMLAGQALTVQAASGDRLVLGVGVAHDPVAHRAARHRRAHRAQHP